MTQSLIRGLGELLLSAHSLQIRSSSERGCCVSWDLPQLDCRKETHSLSQ